MLAVSMEHPPDPQHDAALASLSCNAIAPYFCLHGLKLSIVLLQYCDVFDQKKSAAPFLIGIRYKERI
jgi:hypothetical protein